MVMGRSFHEAVQSLRIVAQSFFRVLPIVPEDCCSVGDYSGALDPEGA